MAEIRYKTRGNASPKGKARVYFTCHPDDFDRYFELIYESIFHNHDCAIYYTCNMSEPIVLEDRDTDLGSCHLFVVPVTFKLLTKQNRAMDEDIPYAIEKHIPVLPIMMEPGIDELYSRPDKFGELQYLNPFNKDRTEIPYSEKLKKYLDAVLVSDEQAQRIRAAFDAYIFLSYRKKDRKYANELMRMIHNNPEFRNIAIWYDEFLTPGESFRENIDKILKNSQLFALLVTPNLMEEVDGKPNYVMANEYPAARASGIEIMPAEMVSTDKAVLKSKFVDIPECIDVRNNKEFRNWVLSACERIKITSNNHDPEHMFLVGLAYLDGIDVETDRSRGLEMITKAAEYHLPEAIIKLYEMYESGTGVKLNYKKAVFWAEKLIDVYKNSFKEENEDTLFALGQLATAYSNCGEYSKVHELREKIYHLSVNLYGKNHPKSLSALGNLGYIYGMLGDYKKSLEINKQVYSLRCSILGEDHLDTISSMGNLASSYGRIGDLENDLYFSEKAYSFRSKILGQEHPDTLLSLNNLAITYGEMGNRKKEKELMEKVYDLSCKTLTENHPDTISTISNLAVVNSDLGNYEEALKLSEKAYKLRFNLFGEEHPDTIDSLQNLASEYGYLGDVEKELELEEKIYDLLRKTQGEEHPRTLIALSNLASTYGNLGNHTSALVYKEKVYTLRCKVFGQEHPETLLAMGNLASTYGKMGWHKKALIFKEKAYELSCKVLGEEHPDTIHCLNNLAVTWYHLNDIQKAYDIFARTYKLCIKVLGENYPLTRNAKVNLDFLNKKLKK